MCLISEYFLSFKRIISNPTYLDNKCCLVSQNIKILTLSNLDNPSSDFFVKNLLYSSYKCRTPPVFSQSLNEGKEGLLLKILSKKDLGFSAQLYNLFLMISLKSILFSNNLMCSIISSFFINNPISIILFIT